MEIKISAIFLMAILMAGFSSFPSSVSNSSTEFADQTNSLNLINMAFAASDEEEKAADRAEKAAEKAAEQQAASDREAAEQQAASDREAAEQQAASDREAAKQQAASDREAAKQQAASDREAAKQQAASDREAADRAEKELEKDDDIQEFNDATVVHMSNTTTICHIPPGNPSNAHTITIGKPAVKAHIAHGDVGGACAENNLENILSKKEIKQAQKLTRLAEKQAEKESMAFDRAIKLIEKLEQRIAQLENRLQTLLNKVESGEYYGTLTQLDTVTKSHSISFDGTATSIYDESVTSGLSGEIFIENLMTGSNTSKFKVTGGEIIVGNNIYDAAFGKVRVSSLGVPGEKDSMVVIIQTFDSEENDNTIKLTLLFDSAIEADLGTEPIDFEIKPNSKISEQWFLSGSGTLSLE